MKKLELKKLIQESTIIENNNPEAYKKVMFLVNGFSRDYEIKIIESIDLIESQLKKIKSDIRLNESNLDEMARIANNIKIGSTPSKVTDFKHPGTQELVSAMLNKLTQAGDKGMSRAELASSVQKTQPNINALLNKMVDKGWLTNAIDKVPTTQDAELKDSPISTPI